MRSENHTRNFYFDLLQFHISNFQPRYFSKRFLARAVHCGSGQRLLSCGCISVVKSKK